MVDGESYEAVSKFCYLGDELDNGRGCDASVTSIGGKAFRDETPFLSLRVSTFEMEGKMNKMCVKSSKDLGIRGHEREETE